MTTDTNIITLYKRAFGFVGGKFPPIDVNVKVAEAAKMDAVKSYQSDLFIGSPFFLPLKIGDLWLPVEPMISLTSSKQIVKTQMTGLKGSIKEEISTDDWSISIRGIIINNTDDNYPFADVAQLRQICETLGSYKVVNKLLAIFDIHEIVIDNYAFDGEEGAQSYQAYTINALSDRPVELILKEGI
ncbi:MAG: DUF6046 domain-containing protein [Bacteroidetes bacterium]|nr:DUF6046 domain-containing protein [Bacteroidota bacterium]